MVVVIDTETTGLDPKTNSVVEIAGQEVLPDKSLGSTWSSLVKPEHPISFEAMAVHHICESEVANAPSLSHVWNTHVGADPAVLAAHNAPFDKSFLPSDARQEWICTWRCARHTWTNAPGYSNQVLRYWLGIEPSFPDGLYPHRALYDAIVTAGILQNLLMHHSQNDLLHLTQEPVLLTTITFGKHKGTSWRDAPRGYLKWILDQSDFDEDVAHTARHYYDA